MKKLKLLFLTIVTITMFSCGSTGSATKTTNKNYTPTEPTSIEIFTSTVPSKAYFEIGTISVKRYKSVIPIKRSDEKVMSNMKTKTASIGGHAIINYRESGLMNTTGTAIRYK